MIQGGHSLALGLALSGRDVTALWGSYLALGGRHSLPHVQAYVAGQTAWTKNEHDIAAQALNEHCHSMGLSYPVSYADDHVSW